MGKFGDAAANFGMGQLFEAGGNLLSEGLDTLFGFSKKKAEQQMEMQKELMNYQLEQSFNWNEKAAENAFSRDMQMYERNYQDQSYSAMRKQMEDAGLSVGLMYGGGAAGGGGGAVTGGAQGGAQGAAPQAPDMAQYQMQKQRQQELALNMAMMESNIEVNKAKAEELRAKAEEDRENARLSTEKKITEMESREHILKGLYESNLGKWIDNLRKRFEDATSAEDDYAELKAEDDYYGQYEIILDGIRNTDVMAEIWRKISEKDKNVGLAEAAWAEAMYNNERTRHYMEEISALVMHANAHRLEALSAKMRADNEAREIAYKYGVDMTPEFVARHVENGLEAIGRIVGGVAGARVATKMVGRFSKGINKTAGRTIVDPKPAPISKAEREQWELIDRSRVR